MNDEALGQVAADLLSLPPLVFRIIRKKIIKTTLADLDVDIRFTHYEVLRLLEQEGTLHITRIGEQLAIARAQMTRLIDHLVELGFVEREPDATDRRTLNIGLADAGRCFIHEHEDTIVNAVRENMSSLEPCDLKNLCTALRNVRDALFKLEA